MKQPQRFKRWEDLDITDDFIFSHYLSAHSASSRKFYLPEFLGAGSP